MPSHSELLGLAYADLEEEIGVSQNDLFLMSEHEMNVSCPCNPVEALGDNYDAGMNKEAQFEFVRMFNEDKEARKFTDAQFKILCCVRLSPPFGAFFTFL